MGGVETCDPAIITSRFGRCSLVFLCARTLWIWLPLWGGPGMLLVVSGIPSKNREARLRDNRSDMPLLYDSRFSIQSTEDIARSFGSREPSMYMQPRSVSTHDSRLKEGSYYSRYDDSDTRLSSL